ncbi:MAG: molybdopterin-guanine dinucleotide biosynthesis protein MobB [Deltaproteobacteria bacterium]|nr:MAG: molybdopterin-guanine dinucleotide biosynthesis protein MobB [Deltaproteobacteria bacterium]
MPIAISIIGYKNAGKTTLTTALARQLTHMGHTVAGVKFSHGGFDQPATDTHDLGQVCEQVIGIGPNETAMFWPQQHYLPDLLPLLKADVVLVEGGKQLTWLPRVLILRSPEEASSLDNGLALGTWGTVIAQGLPSFTSLEDLAREVLNRGFILAGLDCGDCKRPNCLTLAREIVQGKTTATGCKALQTGMKVTINGHPLPMKSFVEDIIAGSIKAQLATLKGYAPGSKIEITLS